MSMRIINLLEYPLQLLTPIGTLLLERPDTVAPVTLTGQYQPIGGMYTELEPTLTVQQALLYVKNLPSQMHNTALVVPQRLAESMPGRPDLLYPIEHPSGCGAVMLVHGASLTVIPGSCVLAAEYPSTDTVDSDCLEGPSACPEDYSDCLDGPSACPDGHSDCYQPGNILMAQQLRNA